MNTREVATEYRLSQWAQILRERSASGQSVRAFCKQNGYRENVYYYWQKKLRETVCQEMPGTSRGAPSRGLVPEDWMVCVEGETAPVPKSVTIAIGPYRVTVESDVDTALLTKVCRALASIC